MLWRCSVAWRGLMLQDADALAAMQQIVRSSSMTAMLIEAFNLARTSGRVQLKAILLVFSDVMQISNWVSVSFCAPLSELPLSTCPHGINSSMIRWAVLLFIV